MNTISRTITGTLAIILGLILIILSFLKEIWVLIYGIPILIIGIFILFNKKEDNIEQIKNKTKGGKK
jgi:membrane-bound ClpP family serine protease